MGYEFMAVYWRDMIRFVRFRAMLFSSLLQPIIWLIFFGLAMSSNFDSISAAIPTPPGALKVDYLTFMGAGVIAMTTLFTSLFGGLTLLFDKNWGLMREMLASPMKRTHILMGITLSGITKVALQVSIILMFGLLIGVKFFQGFSALQVVIALLGIFAFASMFALGFLFLSASIAMRLESMEGVQGVMTLLTMPIFFSSNALYPTDKFPYWLKLISYANPLTYLVRGIRYFALGNDFWSMGTHYTYASSDILLAFGVLTAFAVVMYIFAWVTFKKTIVT